MGLERKSGPASSASSSRKGFKVNSNRLLGIVNKFSIPFGTEKTISICGGLDRDGSDVEQTRRGIILLVLLFLLPVFILLYRFSIK